MAKIKTPQTFGVKYMFVFFILCMKKFVGVKYMFCLFYLMYEKI